MPSRFRHGAGSALPPVVSGRAACHAYGRHGWAVQFRPRGHSMTGKIASGQLCTVEPLSDRVLAVGDIVLCRVGCH